MPYFVIAHFLHFKSIILCLYKERCMNINKNLCELCKGINDYKIVGEPNINIDNLAFSLDEIKGDTLFFCLKNDSKISKAKELGARAVVTEKKVDVDIPQIVVQSSRKAMALMSGNFFDNPANDLKLIGVTGTNGKTTSTYIMKSIFEADNHKVGLIGTNGYMIGGNLYACNMTTPDPIQLHEIFYKMKRANCEYVVMEVSAHALYFDKIEGLKFDAGIFTNLTQDHLDFFTNMDNYFTAKEKFFSPKFLKRAIINIDDEYGQKLLKKNAVPHTFSFGIDTPGDVFAIDINNSIDGSNFVINLFDNIDDYHFSIPGKYNVQNVLGCATCAYTLGISPQNIKNGIERLDSVNGRFQILKTPKDCYAIIDYAHTPDGIENLLKSVKSLGNNRIITVFGCGGNRDRGKRAIMGKIAGQNSNLSIITSDNPRFENPIDIILEIEKGFSPNDRHLCIENRKLAIEYALDIAKPSDCVVICGKGAENYQEINGVKYHFSDSEIVNDWCSRYRKREYESFEK